MRIHGNKMTTTRMVAQARARRQGRAKILSSVSAKRATNTGTSANSKTGSYQSASTSSGSMTQVKKYNAYTQMQEYAEGLSTETKALLKIGTTTQTKDTELTEEEKKAQEQKAADEKTTVVSEIQKVVNYYNGLYDSLEDTGSSANRAFQTQLKNTVKGYEKKLKEIGISIDKTGTLSVTEKTLKNADVEDLKEIFCKKDGLSDKLADKADTLKANASTTLKVMNKLYGTSASSNYTKYGTISDAYAYYKSRYSYRG